METRQSSLNPFGPTHPSERPQDAFRNDEYRSAGATTNFTFEYAVDWESGTTTEACLADIIEYCESDYAAAKALFGQGDPPGLPFNVAAVWGSGTWAVHDSCAGTGIRCVTATGGGGYRLLCLAEVVEVLESAQSSGWNCAWSNGEALSRVLPPAITGQELGGDFETASTWLNAVPRPNFVDANAGTDTDFVSIGCAVLFLNFLAYQLGHEWRDIVQAGGATPAETYARLEGLHDGYARFRELMEHHYPTGGGPYALNTDNPFPLDPPPNTWLLASPSAYRIRLNQRGSIIITAVDADTGEAVTAPVLIDEEEVALTNQAFEYTFRETEVIARVSKRGYQPVPVLLRAYTPHFSLTLAQDPAQVDEGQPCTVEIHAFDPDTQAEVVAEVALGDQGVGPTGTPLTIHPQCRRRVVGPKHEGEVVWVPPRLTVRAPGYADTQTGRLAVTCKTEES